MRVTATAEFMLEPAFFPVEPNKDAGSSRDAIGAVITVQRGDRKLTSQLTAGDGNQSSNERQIIFGLGPNSNAQQVTVRWPSGAIQDYGPLSSQSVWMLIEGQAAVALP